MKPIKRKTQKGRVLAKLLDGRPHTKREMEEDDGYTMRNRIGELEKDGYTFDRFPKWRGGRLTAYRFAGPRPVVWA